MGICSSRTGTRRNSYESRKANGFRDPGLEKHRKDCVAQKKRLKKVTPGAATKASLARSATKASPVSGGPSATTLKGARRNLKKR
ncbi:hypothetical protein TeGR_g5257 [Tetraparma gracilis]|uniref:Uncharacterized protein n=1 Tax=Tetraparma gracilis TaxID=2962635 RepID=A0ABQ6NBA1_9STRA|nr:hypothetical protein TeGR_g5257 [Tetraparma gracilis]